MEESTKNKLIFFLLLSTVLFFVVSAASCSNSHRFKTSRDKELNSRLDVEEKLSSIIRDKSIVEEKLNLLTQELEIEKAEHALAQDLLDAQAAKVKKLEERLGSVKQVLEEDLKDDLTISTASEEE